MSSLRTFYSKVKALFPGKEQLALEGKDKNAKKSHNYKRGEILSKIKNQKYPENRGKSHFHLEFFSDVETWSRLSGLNRRPTVYKTVALPAELSRHACLYYSILLKVML